jgi:hypothetical protein
VTISGYLSLRQVSLATLFGECAMAIDLTADARALDEASTGRRPFSSLYRDIGLATVATEFNVRLDTFEPDVAEAVERGGAALLLARFGPSLTRRPRSVRAGEQGGRHKLRRLARKARQSRRFLTGKFVIPRELSDGIDGRS